jgi:hypothetical protein
VVQTRTEQTRVVANEFERQKEELKKRQRIIIFFPEGWKFVQKSGFWG